MNYISVISGQSLDIVFYGYSLQFTSFVILSSLDSTKTVPFCCFKPVSNKFFEISGTPYYLYKIISNNILSVTLSAIKFLGLYDLIIFNDSGFLKLSDKGYLIDYINSPFVTPTPTVTPSPTETIPPTLSNTPTQTPTPTVTPSVSNPLSLLQRQAKDEVLVLYNLNSEDSIDLKNYYINNRPHFQYVNSLGLDIPQAIYPSMKQESFLINLSGSDLDFPYEHCRKYDFLSESTYLNNVKPQLQTYLNNNSLLKYVVCMIDIPTNLLNNSFFNLSEVEAVPDTTYKYLSGSLTFQIKKDLSKIIFYITASKLSDCKAIIDKLSSALQEGLDLYQIRKNIFTEDTNVDFFTSRNYFDTILSSNSSLSAISFTKTGSISKRYKYNGENYYNNFIIPIDADKIIPGSWYYYFLKNKSLSAVGLNTSCQFGLSAELLNTDFGKFGPHVLNSIPHLTGYNTLQKIPGEWDNVFTNGQGLTYINNIYSLYLSGTNIYCAGNNDKFLLGLDLPKVYKNLTPLTGNFSDVCLSLNSTFFLSAGTDKWFVSGIPNKTIGDYTLKDKFENQKLPFQSELIVSGLPNKIINVGTTTINLSDFNTTYNFPYFSSNYLEASNIPNTLGLEVGAFIEPLGANDYCIMYGHVQNTYLFLIGYQQMSSSSTSISSRSWNYSSSVADEFGFIDVGIDNFDSEKIIIYYNSDLPYATFNTTISTLRPVYGNYQKIISNGSLDNILALSGNTWFKPIAKVFSKVNEKYEEVYITGGFSNNGVGVYLSAGKWFNNKENFSPLGRSCNPSAQFLNCNNRELPYTFNKVLFNFYNDTFYGLSANKIYFSSYNFLFRDELLEPVSGNSEFPFEFPNIKLGSSDFTKKNQNLDLFKLKGNWSDVIEHSNGVFVLSANTNKWFYFGYVWGFFGTNTSFNSNTGIYADYFGKTNNPQISSLAYFGSWGFNGRRFFPPHTNTQNLSNYGNFSISNLLSFQNNNNEDGWYFLDTIESFNGAPGGGSYSTLAGLKLYGWGNFPGSQIKDFLTYKNSPAYNRYYLTNEGASDHGLSGSPIRHSTYTAWFSPSAFGGTNYKNCPIVAYAHVSEPGFVQLAQNKFLNWYQGNTFFNVVTSGIHDSFNRNVFFIGDPLVKIKNN